VTGSTGASAFAFDRFVVQFDSRQLLAEGKPVKVGGRAFDLLAALIGRRERTVSKDELLDVVWPGLIVEENTLQVHISALRKLLGSQSIATIPGRGYRFTAMLGSGDRVTPEATAVVSVSSTQGNLPEVLPPLYGRDDELRAVDRALNANRLVTLVGSAGIGKTRLVQAAARAARDQWQDGAWMVELAQITDEKSVPRAVAQVLGVNIPGKRDPVLELADAMRRSTMLLVLDNCEHLLVPVASLVTALLSQAPAIKLLVTSQEPLHLAEEQILRVPPLAVPAVARVETAHEYGALSLFEARARALDPKFGLDADNLEAVSEVCRRLDGLPLAIELAAARVPLLGAEGVRKRLDDRFRVLTGGGRVGLPRHQTLRAAIEWSYGLLGHEEQAVFRRLGAFVGGFTLESAQQVATDESIDPWAVLGHLGTLVDKSLVIAERGEEPRYRLLETGRAWALERLAEAGELEVALRQHACAMKTLFERSNVETWTVVTLVHHQRYKPDLENLRAALDWARGQADEAELHIALLGASASIVRSAMQRGDAIRYCEEAIGRISSATLPTNEARLLLAWTRMRFPRIGERECAACARAVQIYRASEDTQALTNALGEYGTCLAAARNFASAHLALDEAEALYRTEWSATLRLNLKRARTWLSTFEGRHEESCVVMDQAVVIAKSFGDTYLVVYIMLRLGFAHLVLGHTERATIIGRELIAMVRDNPYFGKMQSLTRVLLLISLLAGGQLNEALEIAREVLASPAHSYRVFDFLDAFAFLALRRGNSSAAARILGRADAQYLARNQDRRPPERLLRDLILDELGRKIAPSELTDLLHDGACLSDEVVASLVLSN